jgi:uncharacterized integral membrane protein
MNIRIMVVLALLFLIVIFTIQNASVVTINFLFWKFSISRALMIFFVFAVGGIAGWSLSVWERYHRSKH